MSERSISNTSMAGSVIAGVGVGNFMGINNSNWWVFLIVGLIVFGIGMTEWGGGK